jgi:hypothetical protein
VQELADLVNEEGPQVLHGVQDAWQEWGEGVM